MINRATLLRAVLLVFIGALWYWALNTYTSNFGVDWHESFYPLTELLLHGSNPYALPGRVFTLWALVPLIPFALLGEHWGGILLYIFNFGVLILLLRRIGHSFTTSLMLMLSPVAIFYLHHLNIDSLVLLGFVLPQPLAFFFLMAKPQAGAGLVAYEFWVTLRTAGWEVAVQRILPVSIALVMNIALYLWAGNKSINITVQQYNMTLFPWFVPAGIILFIAGLRAQKRHYAIAASPFFSPYVSLGSWIVAMLAALENSYVMFGAVLLAWLFCFLHR